MTGKTSTITLEASPLLLLRKIRDVMVAPQSAQERLDRLVQVIAAEMSSDVCSVYLMRAGDVLELFASQGLNPDSVHLTRLSVGEGLVGEIAAMALPLNLADAKSHPKFVYRPETGEEVYSSFIGVPILHSNQTIGVLVIQRKIAQGFGEEQMEVLQTVAMVVAEMIVAGQLINMSELAQGGGAALVSQHITGIKLAPGLVNAPAVVHHARFDIKKVVADDIAHEEDRLAQAMETLQVSLEQLIQSSNLREGDEEREIIETYRMFANDKGWLKQIVTAIHSGLTAEAAVKQVQEQLHARMSQVSSEYIRERMQDLEDLSNRLLQHLAGRTLEESRSVLPEQFVLVARSLGPAELLEYGRTRLQGLILEEGSASSHIVIIARAMDIPVVGKISNATLIINDGDPVIVDGNAGEVYVRPTEDIERTIAEHIKHHQERADAYAAMRDLPPVTADGVRISLNINVGLFVDGKQLQEPDVDGIGLYRTELPYMVTTQFPDIKYQTKIYAKILRQAENKRVIFRSFDIGGDKRVPYLEMEEEENPAMGWRATRIGLDRPAILRRQFRALILAAAGKELNVMLPFITEIAELDAASKLLYAEMRRAEEKNDPMPSSLRVGTMIEVPALLYQLDALAERVDFVSIGSNDLLQFLFACDRGSAKMIDRYDTLSPVVLQVVRQVVEVCGKHGVDVGFCGEMARKPLDAMALIGLGIRNLSMPSPSVGPVKAMIRTLPVKAMGEYVEYLSTLPDASVRQKLAEFAKDHGVTIDQ